MADKLRQMAQKLKDRVQVAQIAANVSKDKVGSIMSKYAPAVKVSELADKIKQETIGARVKGLVTKYEKFTGVQEILAIQKSVVAAQERFMQAQDKRRELGREVSDISAKLKEIHTQMQNTMKGDGKYLQLVNDEHKLILLERALKEKFSEAEREEREQFAAMSAAVKLGHEREKAHAERNKYWYIVASISGTILGIAGSTLNNHMKMAEFRDMLQDQMSRAVGGVYATGGGDVGGQYQEHIARSMKTMQELINHLVLRTETLSDHISKHEEKLHKEMKDLKGLVVSNSMKSAKSDAALAKALSHVQHDIEDHGVAELYKFEGDSIVDDNKLSLDRQQIVTGIGIIGCLAFVIGNILGRQS